MVICCASSSLSQSAARSAAVFIVRASPKSASLGAKESASSSTLELLTSRWRMGGSQDWRYRSASAMLSATLSFGDSHVLSENRRETAQRE